VSGNYNGNWGLGYNINTANDFSISTNYNGNQYDGVFHISNATRNVGIGTTSPQKIFHVAGTGYTTWAGFAGAIFAAAAASGGPYAAVQPIPTSAYPTATLRPANSRLDCTKLHATHGVLLPHWRTSTRSCVTRLIKGASQEDGT